MSLVNEALNQIHLCPAGIIRHGQQPGNNNPNVPQHGPRIVGLADAEPRSHPSSVPLPGDGDKHAGGFGLTTMSAALVRIFHPTPFYPLTPCLYRAKAFTPIRLYQKIPAIYNSPPHRGATVLGHTTLRYALRHTTTITASLAFQAGYYAESYKGRPEDPTAPKEGRS